MACYAQALGGPKVVMWICTGFTLLLSILIHIRLRDL
ncbi:Uncharacterised protein [Yersinia aldovae]|uniref:Uncharacterized protein n=1 Tax=Yersinia aldovae TaxID=29483 RepID=A0ABM9SRN8_YERAL|nr:Uncharacterised protein [Yersinia aldovae]CNK63046.1 Uncharacterised protein [Yersinia aldovae]